MASMHDEDEAVAGCACSLQLPLQILHVIVCIPVPRGLAQPHPVDDRCMVQRIRNDGVVLAEQRLEHPAVCIEGRCVQDGVVCPVKCSDGVLELPVDVLGAADEAHARHAESVGVDGPFGRFHHPRMAAQSEVVVCAKIEHTSAVFQNDFSPLR
jgi:hypothetical protein